MVLLPTPQKAALALALSLAAVPLSGPASAQTTIKQPGNHPRYSFEAEPHLAVNPFGKDGFGPGFRGTIVVVENGFVSSINNSVGVGFGADFLFYGKDQTELFLPVVLQWNFWLHRNWSVFGEPGIILHVRDKKNDDLELSWFTVFGGGRYHFSDALALTLRAGAPLVHHNTISVGLSMLL
jgi:hypothetical protein